ncbi:OmpA family protein [Winogradskyella sp. PG-2]|uniref:OmpA family protein n=1 Tax=Winogradskyella sp. PG-2 TaxID=754409 RepID=UPI00045876F1|nr:OmpA family protein [Winogradskyella sp. PG-2]BAO76684.1 outer membrane lipoprotein omp16 precursor [Winogradskyella sp. PG-2]
MKTLSRYILLTVVFVTSSVVYAQEGKIRSVKDDYREFAYVKTSEVLLEVANKGYRSADLFQKLGNSYYFQNKMEDAAKWYGELITMNEVIDPEYYFRYALALKGIENYEESDKWMTKFNKLKPQDSRGKAFLSKVDYKSDIEELSRNDIEIVNLEINTELSDFGTTEYENGIVFASARGGGRKYRWNEQPYLDIYSVEKTDEGSFSEVNEIQGKVNTKYHESSAVFSPNGQYMFFTRNNYFRMKYKEDESGINRLQLYRATLSEDGSWDEIHKIHFNSEDYSVAHPALNLTGSRLYFASDMPGTYGQSDIFVVDVNDDGTLGEPENLGAGINTEGQESFPFVNTSGDLFFSSNGYPGLGGFDVFKSEGLDQKVQAGSNRNFPIENIGKPVNSAFDDFGYYENLVTRRVYFSSNREGGKGSDDIYTFEVPECEQLVEGTVQDKKTDELIPNATVVLFDGEGNEIERTTVGADATFEFNLDCEKEYLIRGEKETYASDEKRFTTPDRKQELQLQLLLEKDEVIVEPCSDLAKLLDIPIIYFDFDKFNIRYDAEVELQKVLAVLNKYPSMTIDVRSHTDCRATMVYNERLSENRAQSTRQYLIDNGIDAARITAKGYGESRLVNDCGCEPTNESSCSEEEHQLNRRSEFIVTSFKGQKCPEQN